MPQHSHHGHKHQHEFLEGQELVQNHGNSRALLLTVLLNIVITLVEIAGGILSGSLALLSDALHNFSDSSALFISYFALRISRRQADLKKTYGYKRIEILAANLNASILFIVAFFLFREALNRLFTPAPINSLVMLIVAATGLLGNLVSVLILHRRITGNLNLRSAYLHLFSDTVSSVAVIVGGIAIYFFGVYWLDPLLTLGIGVYVLIQSFSILFETANILMQSAPKDIDLRKLKAEVELIPGVDNLHHVHIWRLNERDVFFEGHIELEQDVPAQSIDDVRIHIETLLARDFKITHTTLQLSFGCCEEKLLIATHPKEEKKKPD
jgi:cobalt-zinc-cadmium efflux system protein